ncbi:MAG: hypothetical protein ABR614_02255 [Mycobacteriales bacterium]
MPVRPVVLAVAGLMVALPTSTLAVRWATEGSRPVSELPASWQMYSAVPPSSYRGLDATGRTRRLGVDDLPLVLRAVDTGRLVPDRLCARAPDLVAVERRGGPDPGTFRC